MHSYLRVSYDVRIHAFTCNIRQPLCPQHVSCVFYHHIPFQMCCVTYAFISIFICDTRIHMHICDICIHIHVSHVTHAFVFIYNMSRTHSYPYSYLTHAFLFICIHIHACHVTHAFIFICIMSRRHAYPYSYVTHVFIFTYVMYAFIFTCVICLNECA